ncbi:hypothetical protein CRYUN_Cryun23aG0119600 [Craigia yunnanensis]
MMKRLAFQVVKKVSQVMLQMTILIHRISMLMSYWHRQMAPMRLKMRLRTETTNVQGAGACAFYMHEEHVASCNDFSFFCASNANFDEIQHQSSTNEQDNEIQHQSSSNEQDDEIQNQSSTNEQNDEIQHQSSTNEQDDEFWNNIFNDDDAYLDERSYELFVGSESSGLLVGRNLPIESSRK